MYIIIIIDYYFFSFKLKVVDFGSAELKIFRYLKDILVLNQIFLVDIDADVLQGNHNTIKPLTLEFIFPRPSPLNVKVMCGSAGDLDSRLVGCEAATLVEM